jgi:hypothetical protein
MLKTLTIAAVLAFSASAASAAPALDAKGKCRDAGKFVAASMCKVTAPAGKCRDIKTKKFAKCSAPGSEALRKK